MKRTPEIIKIAARNLRKNQTVSEKILWDEIKDRKLKIKFQRQYPLYLFTEDS
jgi:very-short-patch-repair endonuclease